MPLQLCGLVKADRLRNFVATNAYDAENAFSGSVPREFDESAATSVQIFPMSKVVHSKAAVGNRGHLDAHDEYPRLSTAALFDPNRTRGASALLSRGKG